MKSKLFLFMLGTMLPLIGVADCLERLSTVDYWWSSIDCQNPSGDYSQFTGCPSVHAAFMNDGTIRVMRPAGPYYAGSMQPGLPGVRENLSELYWLGCL